MTSPPFASELTDDEVAFGFVLADGRSSDGILAIANLGSGLYAVKVLGHGGKAQYLVCDERLAPLYPAALSLDELRRRFLNR